MVQWILRGVAPDLKVGENEKANGKGTASGDFYRSATSTRRGNIHRVNVPAASSRSGKSS